MLRNINKSALFIFLVIQTNFLFSKNEIKNIDPDISKPKYTILLDYMELSVLTSAIVDGISKYKGNIEFETNAKYNGNQVSWEITTDNKRVFEVLNLYIAQKSLGFLKSINLDSTAPIEKATIASLSSLSTKLDDALRNPIWDSQKISGILTNEGDHYYVFNNEMYTELTGTLINGLENLIGNRVVVSGFAKEPGKIELTSIHFKKGNTLELFIMSQCPFGIQALEYIFNKTDSLLANDQIKLEVHYIFTKKDSIYTSLHGEQEIVENIVQIVIRDKFPQFFTEYLKQRIISPSETWQQIATNSNINKKIIQEINAEITSNRNLIIQNEYSYMIENYQQINSSPTFIWESEIVNSLDEIPRFKSDRPSNIQKCEN